MKIYISNYVNLPNASFNIKFSDNAFGAIFILFEN